MGERADNDHNRAMDDHTDARDDRDNMRTDHDDLVIIKTQVGQIKETLDKIDSKLMGNGKEGLCVTVEKHTLEFQTMKEYNDKRQRITLAVVAIIVSLGMFAMAVLNYFKI